MKIPTPLTKSSKMAGRKANMTTTKGITPSILTDQVSLEIQVNNRPVKQYKHNKKVYIEGRKDSEYSILVKNDNNVPVYAIVSVDGLSVIDGSPASENSVGFLIKKKSSITVLGWMISEKEVAKFTFSEKKAAYTEQTNKKNAPNIGVIGCIIIAEKDETKDWEKILKEIKKYQEKEKEYIPYPVPYPTPYPVYPSPWDWDYYRPRIWYHSPYYNGITYSNNISYSVGGTSGLGVGVIGSGDNLSSYGSGSSISNSVQNFGNFSIAGDSGLGNINSNYSGASGAGVSCNNVSLSSNVVNSSDEKLGTAFGDKAKMKDADLDKPFDIGDIIKSFVIYYDNRKNLEKLGISFEKKKIVQKEPNPFPASKFKFCKPPEDWS